MEYIYIYLPTYIPSPDYNNKVQLIYQVRTVYITNQTKPNQTQIKINDQFLSLKSKPIQSQSLTPKCPYPPSYSFPYRVKEKGKKEKRTGLRATLQDMPKGEGDACFNFIMGVFCPCHASLTVLTVHTYDHLSLSLLQQRKKSRG